MYKAGGVGLRDLVQHNKYDGELWTTDTLKWFKSYLCVVNKYSSKVCK